MNIGIVGTGYIASEFMKSMPHIQEEMVVKSVVSRRYENALRFAEEYNISNVCNQYEEMLKDVDSVYIATQNDTHYDYTKRALEAGKHVLCEKPATISEKDFKELQQIAANKKVIYIDAMRTLDLPIYKKTKQLIKDNVIGDIVSIEGSLGRISSRLYRHTPELAGGSLMDLGIYPIYAIVDLLGTPIKIQSSVVKLDSGVDGAVNGILSFEKQLGFFYASCISQTRCDLRICGNKGTITVPKHFTTTNNIIIEGADGSINYLEEGILENGLTYEIDAFAKMVCNEDLREAEKRQDLFQKVIRIMDQIRKDNEIVFNVG